MENINDIINSLSDDDIQNLKGMAKELFSSGEADGTDMPNLDLSSLSSLMLPKDDDRTRLIKALKPMLSDERQKRADEAIRLLQLASMLPALQQSGILEKFLEGEDGLL